MRQVTGKILLVVLLGLIAAGPEPAAGNEGPHHPGARPRSQLDAEAWTSSWPLLEANRRGRDGLQLAVHNFAAEVATLYPPGGGKVELPLTDGRALVAETTSGNYHWLTVTGRDGHGRVVALHTTVYLPGAGPSPRKLLAATRTELEIVPQPLPRERMLYRGGETWSFRVLHRGRPLGGAKLHLETEFGSTAVFTGDARGRVRVQFPDDIPASAWEAAGPRGPEGRFVLAAEHEEAEPGRLATFTGRYRPHVYTDRSPGRGAGFIGLGILAAAPLLFSWRRRA
jgi:hypothetical protein